MAKKRPTKKSRSKGKRRTGKKFGSKPEKEKQATGVGSPIQSTDGAHTRQSNPVDPRERTGVSGKNGSV